MTPAEATLFTRRGCCLCDDAKAKLERLGVMVTEVDIDADPGLKQRYGECVPVVLIDGQERFRGRIDEWLLRRLLNSRSAE